MTREITFLDAVATLQGWVGDDVAVIVEPRNGPTQGVACIRGQLATDPDAAEPIDEEEFTFLVGAEDWFSLHRVYVEAVDLDGDHLQIFHDEVLIHVRREVRA